MLAMDVTSDEEELPPFQAKTILNTTTINSTKSHQIHATHDPNHRESRHHCQITKPRKMLEVSASAEKGFVNLTTRHASPPALHNSSSATIIHVDLLLQDQHDEEQVEQEEEDQIERGHVLVSSLELSNPNSSTYPRHPATTSGEEGAWTLTKPKRKPTRSKAFSTTPTGGTKGSKHYHTPYYSTNAATHVVGGGPNRSANGSLASQIKYSRANYLSIKGTTTTSLVSPSIPALSWKRQNSDTALEESEVKDFHSQQYHSRNPPSSLSSSTLSARRKSETQSSARPNLDMQSSSHHHARIVRHPSTEKDWLKKNGQSESAQVLSTPAFFLKKPSASDFLNLGSRTSLFPDDDEAEQLTAAAMRSDNYISSNLMTLSDAALSELESQLDFVYHHCESLNIVDYSAQCVIVLNRYVDMFKKLLASYSEPLHPTKMAASPTDAFSEESSSILYQTTAGQHELNTQSLKKISVQDLSTTSSSELRDHSEAGQVRVFQSSSTGTKMVVSWASVISTKSATAPNLHRPTKTPLNKEYLTRKQAKAQMLRNEQLTEKTKASSKSAAKIEAVQKFKEAENLSLHERKVMLIEKQEKAESLRESLRHVPRSKMPVWPEGTPATRASTSLSIKSDTTETGQVTDDDQGALVASIVDKKEKRLDTASLQEAALERRRQQERERVEKLLREQERRRELEGKKEKARLEKEAQALAAKADKMARVKLQKDLNQEKELELRREIEERIESTLKRKDEQTAKVKEKAAAANKNASMVVSRMQASRQSPEPRLGDQQSHIISPGDADTEFASLSAVPESKVLTPAPPPPVIQTPAYIKRFKKIRSKINGHTKDYVFVVSMNVESSKLLLGAELMEIASRLYVAFSQVVLDRKMPKKLAKMEQDLQKLSSLLPSSSDSLIAKSYLVQSGILQVIMKSCSIFDTFDRPLLPSKVTTEALKVVALCCDEPAIAEFILRDSELPGIDLIHLLDGILPFCTLSANLYLDAASTILNTLAFCLRYDPGLPSETWSTFRKSQDDHISMLLHCNIVERIRSFFFIAHGPLTDGSLSSFLLYSCRLFEVITAFRSGAIMPVFASKLTIASTGSMTCFASIVSSCQSSELFGMVTMLDSLVMYFPNMMGCCSGNGFVKATFPPLARSVVEIGLSVLRTLNHIAHLDLKMFQEIVESEGMQLQFYHLLAFWLKYWIKFNDESDLFQETLCELLLLIGHVCLDSPKNKEMLRYGQSPNILQLLSNMEFSFFVSDARVNVLPVLAIAITDDPDNQFVVEEEMSLAHISLYLEEASLLHAQQRESMESAPENPHVLPAAKIPFSERFELPYRLPREKWVACLNVCSESTSSLLMSASSASLSSPSS